MFRWNQLTRAFALMLLMAPSAFSQINRVPTGRLPVIVVISDRYASGNASATLLRKAHGGPDVIVLPTTATGEDLVSATLLIESLMDDEGDVARTDRVLAVNRVAGLPAAELTRAGHALEAIRASNPRELSNGLGLGRGGVIYVPNAATRDKSRNDGKFVVQKRP